MKVAGGLQEARAYREPLPNIGYLDFSHILLGDILHQLLYHHVDELVDVLLQAISVHAAATLTPVSVDKRYELAGADLGLGAGEGVRYLGVLLLEHPRQGGHLAEVERVALGAPHVVKADGAELLAERGFHAADGLVQDLRLQALRDSEIAVDDKNVIEFSLSDLIRVGF